MPHKKSFDRTQRATPERQRDANGRWLVGAKPRGQVNVKKKVPSKDDLIQLERLAALGYGTYEVAKRMGICRNTLLRWFKDYPDADTAWKRGLESEEHLILSELLRILKERGNPLPGIFLLKSRHGYREGDSAGADNRVAIQVTMPAALDVANYKKITQTLQLPERTDDE